MAKLKFTPDPTFKITVKVPVEGTGSQDIEITYRRRTRTEHVEFSKSVQERYGALGTPTEDNLDAYREVESDVLMEMIAAWGFEEPLTKENVKHVVEQYGKAASAFGQAYWDSYDLAKLGNSDK